jgi:hypothetical protein
MQKRFLLRKIKNKFHSARPKRRLQKQFSKTKKLKIATKYSERQLDLKVAITKEKK